MKSLDLLEIGAVRHLIMPYGIVTVEITENRMPYKFKVTKGSIDFFDHDDYEKLSYNGLCFKNLSSAYFKYAENLQAESITKVAEMQRDYFNAIDEAVLAGEALQEDGK